MKFKKGKIGLVLGGGGAKGLAHIGVLKVLNELGIKPDIITGTSMGALIGALYASGKSADEIEYITENIDKKEMKKIFKITLSGTGFIDGEKIKNYLEELFNKKNIQSFPIKFGCVACNIFDGSEVVFSKGNIIDALRASISIPVVFTPAKIGKTVIIDGGLVNPVPIDLARELGAKTIIAVNVLSVPKMKHKNLSIPDNKKKYDEISNDKMIENINIKAKNFIEKEIENIETLAKKFASILDFTNEMNILDIVSQTILLAERNIAQSRIEMEKPDIIIEPQLNTIQHFDFYKTKEAMLIGEKETWKQMAKSGLKMKCK